MLNFKNNRNKLEYIVCLGIIIIIQAIRYFPFKFGGWNQIQLSLNYSYGFVQRAFMGTVLDVISKVCNIPWRYMRYLYGIGTMLIFTLLLIIIVWKSLQISQKDDIMSTFFKGMSILFFVGPGWNTYYSNFALTDVWLPILSIFAVYLIVKDKCFVGVVATTIICVLIHPAYVFLYFNFVLVMYVYHIFIQDDLKKRRNIIKGCVCFVLTSAMFIYMMFYAKATAHVNIDHVMSRTAEFVSKSVEEISNHKPTIEGYLFREGTVTGVQYVIQEYWLIFLVMMVMLSPYIYEVSIYWKNVSDNAKKNREKNWWIYMLIPLGIITTVPMYIMHNDYGRWTYAVFFYEFGIIWLLNMINDKNVVYATNCLICKVKDKKMYYYILFFYAIVMGGFEQNLINPLVSTIETYAWKVLEIFGM